jgi:phosphatidylinositol 3-kinase
MCPLKLDFYTHSKSEEEHKKPAHMGPPQKYSVIFKSGDDVRQDQLVLQIIQLMDNLLKQINLDFKFTAYKVLAFSKEDGMLEFVKDSHTIQDLLKDNKNRIEDFFKGLATTKHQVHSNGKETVQEAFNED